MDHLSEQLQHRFLARLLSPEETLDVIKHLRECDACREKLLAVRSAKPSSLVNRILPEAPEEEHPSADSLGAYLDNDLGGPDKVDLEEHLRTCELCQNALADLKSFREELLQEPSREYMPIGTIFAPAQIRTRWFSRKNLQFVSWFNQPPAFAGAVAVAALLVVIGVVFVRSLGTSQNSPNRGIAVVDGNNRIFLDPNGILNPPVELSKSELAVLNKLARPVWENGLPALSPKINDTLSSLKRAPSVLLGQPSAKSPFHLLSPVHTLIESVQPTFKWTSAPGATLYIVHVIAEDRTQEEVATSPEIPALSKDVVVCTWTVPNSISLVPGKRYRWYVTAVIDNQEIDAPGMGDAQAKFALLSKEELEALEVLKKQNPNNRLLEGLLNLNAGLLDDAQNDFQVMLEDPKQTTAAKEFLSRMITQIQRLKES